MATHSGNIGVKQGLDVIVDAAALNRADESTMFLCVGNGAECERTKRRAADLGLGNVRFLPLLDELDFRGLMAASGICLVTQRHSVSEIAFPWKNSDLSCSGTPCCCFGKSRVRGCADDARIGRGKGCSGRRSGGAFVDASAYDEAICAKPERMRENMHARDGRRRGFWESWNEAWRQPAGPAMRSLAWKG